MRTSLPVGTLLAALLLGACSSNQTRPVSSAQGVAAEMIKPQPVIITHSSAATQAQAFRGTLRLAATGCISLQSDNQDYLLSWPIGTRLILMPKGQWRVEMANQSFATDDAVTGTGTYVTNLSEIAQGNPETTCSAPNAIVIAGIKKER